MDFFNLPSMDRPLVAHTALGPQLGFLSLRGTEALSSLFEFEVELVSGTYLLDVRSMLNTELTIEIETSTGSPRFLSGKVTDFSLLGRERANSPYYLYKATVRPSLWYLSQGQDSRIFQFKTVPDILKQVLGEYGFPVEYQLSENYRQWEYCVQYQESDFNFVSRLMEHEGMYYYFQHDNGSHTLVITDKANIHSAFPEYDVFTYFDAQSNVDPDREQVFSWQRRAGMTPAKYSVVDYDFRKPLVKLDALESEALAGDDPSLEMYEWQGGYQEVRDGNHYAKLRLQELKVNQEVIRATTNERGAAPGYTFTLRNHPRSAENKEYLIIHADYQMGVAGYSSGTDREDHFKISFDAIPAEVQYRAPRITKQPKTSGPQTAKVVGPAGQELYTDEYGRIKAQFHWDRDGKDDENSSCWIRVSSPWAGGGFGGLQLPRIGDEVVVDFIGGNPDRPIVLGRMYNRMNMPPVNLPDEANISGFRTQSVFGDASTENFLLFTDKLGQELIDMRAQMDMVLNVLNNLDITVGNNRTEHIKNDLKTTVDNTEERTVKSTRTTTVEGLEKGIFKDGRKEYVTSGGQLTRITGGETHTVTSDGRTTTINGDEKETIHGNEVIRVNGTREETVTQAVTENFNKTYDLTVKEATTRTFNNDVTDNITGKVTENIEGEVIKTITGSLQQSISETTTRTYTGAIKDTLEATWDVTADGNITFTAPKISMKSTKLWEKIQKVHKFYIYSGATGVYKVDSAAIARNGYITKMDLAGSKHDYFMKKNGAAAKDDEKLGWKKVKAGLNVERKILQHSVAAVKNYKPGIMIIS